MIRYEIDLDLFGVDAARTNLAKSDPQLQFALTLFPEAEQLLELSARRDAARDEVAGQAQLANAQVPSPKCWELGLGPCDCARPPHPAVWVSQPKILWCRLRLATTARPC